MRYVQYEFFAGKFQIEYLIVEVPLDASFTTKRPKNKCVIHSGGQEKRRREKEGNQRKKFQTARSSETGQVGRQCEGVPEKVF